MHSKKRCVEMGLFLVGPVCLHTAIPTYMYIVYMYVVPVVFDTAILASLYVLGKCICLYIYFSIKEGASFF